MNLAQGFLLDFGEKFPHLAAAPIAEAVIQWRARATKWPDSEQLRQHLTEELPNYPECRPQHQLELKACCEKS
ncbi:MAG: hypothetical protein WD847_13690 [Pirellulales bacterium]